MRRALLTQALSDLSSLHANFTATSLRFVARRKCDTVLLRSATNGRCVLIAPDRKKTCSPILLFVEKAG
jgi:hypothetical protein